MDSYYVEGRVPLVGSTNRAAFLEQLEVNVSGRHDSYKTTATSNYFNVTSQAGPFPDPEYFVNRVGSTDYLAGLRYAPLRDLVLRTSFGTGFLPPGLNQVVPISATQFFAASIDPKRGGTPVQTPYASVVGGNPDLQPETSRSWSIGFILTPRSVEDLRLSLDYTRINKKSEITSPDLDFLLANEDSFPGRIVRGANLPTDPPGWAGPVTAVDSTLINTFFSSVRSLDLQLDYKWMTASLGTFSVSTIASQARRFERQVVLGSPEFDSVGHDNGPLRWRGNLALGWERGSWAATWSTQYYDAYSVIPSDASTAGAEQIVRNQGGAMVHPQLYHDVSVTYRIVGPGYPMLADTVWSLGIQNVFNAVPPILVRGAPESIGSATYSTYGDPRLRRFSLSVQKSFGKH